MFANRAFLLLLGLCTAFFMMGCSRSAPVQNHEEKLKVVATTSIVGDVVKRIGGEDIELLILLPLGTDPHSYDAIPRDVVAVSEADVVFANGAGLEEFLQPLLESAGAIDRVVDVSEGVEFLNLGEGHSHEDDVFEPEGVDPHTWTDPHNVMMWVESITRTLREMDPTNSAIYEENARIYQEELESLDDWIQKQTAQVSPANRKIVTDHLTMGYFSRRYGYTQIGAIIPSYSSMSAPSARELAQLEESIRGLGVKAIFVGNTLNPGLAERVAEDTGTRLVYIYTGSLSEAGGEADTYLKYMRYNTKAFVDNLK